mmetsp:Transcript_41536/g.134666  ORF Transcript_41536/g.134666 Transcript_41536/m.134666 type:complete len:234 (-) Transcript_41536:128-829(-)
MRPTALADVGSLASVRPGDGSIANDQATSMVLSARESCSGRESDSDSGSSCTTEYSWRRQVIEYPWAEPSFTVCSVLLAPWRSSSPVTVYAPLPVPDAKRIACGQRGLSLFAALGHHQRLGEALKCARLEAESTRCSKEYTAPFRAHTTTTWGVPKPCMCASVRVWELLPYARGFFPGAKTCRRRCRAPAVRVVHSACRCPSALPNQRDRDGDRTPLHWPRRCTGTQKPAPPP